MINVRPLTAHIKPSHTHKVAIALWPFESLHFMQYSILKCSLLRCYRRSGVILLCLYVCGSCDHHTESCKTDEPTKTTFGSQTFCGPKEPCVVDVSRHGPRLAKVVERSLCTGCAALCQNSSTTSRRPSRFWHVERLNRKLDCSLELCRTESRRRNRNWSEMTLRMST